MGLKEFTTEQLVEELIERKEAVYGTTGPYGTHILKQKYVRHGRDIEGKPILILQNRSDEYRKFLDKF